MDRVVVACADGVGRSRAAVDWAAHEASLRDLPLGVVYSSPPDCPRAAAMLVLGVPAAADDAPGHAVSSAFALADVFACPVVLVPDDLAHAAAPVRNSGGAVLLGIDARRPAAAAVDFAFDAARVRDARLRAVHAWELPSSAAESPFGVSEEDRAAWEDQEVQLLADALRPWRAKYPGVPVLEDVLLFSPSQALNHHAARAALAVVGRGPDRAPGIARSLLREAGCPVAIVP
jgi:nucleotide-binding universal stress UspA family protein